MLFWCWSNFKCVSSRRIVDSGTELLWTVIILFVCSDSCVHRTWIPADSFVLRQTEWLRFLVHFYAHVRIEPRVKLPSYFHRHADNNNNCQAANGYGFWLSVIVYLVINISCKGFTNLTVSDVLYFLMPPTTTIVKLPMVIASVSMYLSTWSSTFYAMGSWTWLWVVPCILLMSRQSMKGNNRGIANAMTTLLMAMTIAIPKQWQQY